MNYEFEPRALAELVEAMNYLDQDSPGLGDELHDEVARGIGRILEQPERWPVISEHTRRYLLRRFRYQLIYEVRGGVVLILAVAHTSRRPGYWRDRL